MTFNQSDITIRILTIKQEIVNLSVKYGNALIYGSDYKKCLEDKINILGFLNEIFCQIDLDFDPTIEDFEDFNCFTEDEINQLFDYISTTFNIYFPQYTGDNQ